MSVYVMIIGLLLGVGGVPQAQTPPAAPADTSPALLDKPATPETVAARKAEVLEQLKALADADKAAHAQLDQLLAVLTGLEGTWRHRETFTATLDALPQRLRDAETDYQQLQARAPQQFPTVTEQQYDEAQRQQMRLAEYTRALPFMRAPQRDASIARLRQVFNAQRMAMREQQQVLLTLMR